MGKLLIVFTRPFWLDEWHTLLIANRPSLGQVFSDLHRGSDFGPPLVHIITWTLGQILGEITPLSTRIVSLSCVLGAIVFVFLALRRRIGLAGSVAGALAVASHVLVVAHAIELRFYCLWLLFAAAFAWALMLDGDKPVSRRRDAALAIFAILICMSHWLAVLSLGLMCVGAMASFGRDWRAGLRRVLPAAAGFIVLAASAPLLFGQRAAIVEKSWMPDVNFGHIVYTTRIFWGGTILILGVLVILVGMLRTNVKEPLTGSIRDAIRDPSIAALLSLIALPVLMMIVSLRQPAMHERYSITVLLAWAPVIAVAVQSLGRVMRGAFYLVLLTTLWLSIFNRAVESGRIAYSVGVGRRALAQACTMNLPVVFQVRHLMYPSTEGPSLKWARCDIRYLAMSNATLQRMYGPGNNTPRFFRAENEFARLHQRLYDYPKVVEQAHLDSLPRFVMVAWDASLPAGYKEIETFGRAVFPNHRVTRITPNLSVVERVR